VHADLAMGLNSLRAAGPIIKFLRHALTQRTPLVRFSGAGLNGPGGLANGTGPDSTPAL
jgi:hypothetical protein